MADNFEQVAAQLTALVRAKTGDAGARAHSLASLPGHAGFSYSFVLERSDRGAPAGNFVVRIAPPGVKISGPADIVRHARAGGERPTPRRYRAASRGDGVARRYAGRGPAGDLVRRRG